MARSDRPAAAQIGHDQQLLEALANQPLSDYGLTTCCRLIMRYENTGPGTSDLARTAQAQLETWGLDRRKAFAASRKLWASGYRPELDQAAQVGSGADAFAT